MNSAQGQVQHLGYKATFPLLLNIADQPSYFMALKDAAGLVKMYAMVNVNQYQIVATGSTVAECEQNYRRMLAQSNIIGDDETDIQGSIDGEIKELAGAIAEIRSAVIEGTSYYYIRLEGERDFAWRASAAEIPYAPLLDAGDAIVIRYIDGHAGLYWTDVYGLEIRPGNE